MMKPQRKPNNLIIDEEGGIHESVHVSHSKIGETPPKSPSVDFQA